MKITFNNFLKNKNNKLNKKTNNKKSEKNNKEKYIKKDNIKEIINIKSDEKNIKKLKYIKVYEKNGDVKKYSLNKEKDNRKINFEEYKKQNNFVKTEKKDIKFKNNKRKLFKNGTFLFGLMIFGAIISLNFVFKNNYKINDENYAVFNEIKNDENKGFEQSSISNNKDTKNIIELKNSSKNGNSIVNNSINNEKKGNNKNNKKTVKKSQIIKLEFERPLKGEISKIFSEDKVIYSKTLELWKTHEGIDIKANENDVVKSIEKGIVEKVFDDSFYGKTVIIDHGQGYKSCYCNLDNNVFVKPKQVVKKQTKIAKVGKTSVGEIKDELHLHFVLLKNNLVVDPSFIFKN